MPEPKVPHPFEAALLALTQWLANEKVPFTAIGGLAVSLLAQPRATQDIDVVIWLDAERWGTFIQAGEEYGFKGRIGDVLEFAARARVFLLRHGDAGVSVDISCGALPFEREMIERAKPLQIGRVTLNVPTPEDLIITKAVAHRPKDFQDIVSLLDTHKDLDVARIRHWAGEFAAALETPEVASDLERLLQRHPQG